ncbi:hypothetical protein BDV12DRAFT_177956 [Aspergillus spectabilis]
MEAVIVKPHQRAPDIHYSLDRVFVGIRRTRIRKTLERETRWESTSYGHPFFWRTALIDKIVLVHWSSVIYEHISRDGVTFPHNIIVTQQSVNAAEDEMLTGELGPIISAKANRLQQAEFAEVELFPVGIYPPGSS